jgi:M6 family metalloprotease-like protein
MARSARPASGPAATVIAFALLALWPLQDPAAGLFAQVSIGATGTLTAVWGDPPATTSAEPALHWVMTDDQGRALEVEIGAELLRQAGGFGRLDRRRVTAEGALDRPRPEDRESAVVLRATTLRLHDTAAAPRPHTVGSRPYAVLLCRFADIAAEPRPTSFFETLMGGGYPNMSHYYEDVSGGRMDLSGSRVFGWFTLPDPHAAYFDEPGIVASLNRVADDCIAAAGATNLTGFSGVILQVNAPLAAAGAGMAWGGSRMMAVDGETRIWPFVWMPGWAMEESRFGIYAHEIGHSLGLPHSSGPTSGVYDSSWDVMSRPYLLWDPALRGWIPGGTIGFHKALLGWITEDRVLTATGPTPREIRLSPHSDPRAGRGTLLLRIPIPGSPDFYTVEARRQTGYDRALPDAAVIMHRVPDPDGPDCTLQRCARVVAARNSGDPAGAGAMWGPGGEFDDGIVSVRFTDGDAAGWNLVVSVAMPEAPTGLTPERAADALFQNGSLTAEELQYLDLMGNRNGRYDLGDFLAFVRSR